MINIDAFDLQELQNQMAEKNIKYLWQIRRAALLPITNWTSLVIYPNSTGEAVFVAYSDDEKEKIKMKKIKHNPETGSCFFTYLGQEYDTQEFLINTI